MMTFWQWALMLGLGFVALALVVTMSGVWVVACLGGDLDGY